MPRLEEWLPMTGNGQDRTRLTDPLAFFLRYAVKRSGAQSAARTSFDGTE